MNAKVLKNMSVEQLDKLYAALPYNNPYKDEVGKEIESRVSPKKEDETEDVVEKALQTLFNL